MARGSASEGERSSGTPVPVPIAQRIGGIVPALKTLQLLLSEVSFEDYRDGLHSRDPLVLKDKVLPLERAFEIITNYLVELAALALEELGIAPVDGVRDLRALADEGIISKQLAEQLVDLHRARNGLQHQYPDARASIIYPACEQAAKVVAPFAQSYLRWLDNIGYAVPSV